MSDQVCSSCTFQSDSTQAKERLNMALNDTLKTRILLRNDTLANWETSTLKLGKGEVAIATLTDGKLAEVRVGTGSSTWADALKLNVDASQISGLVDTIKGTSKKYQIVANGTGGNSWKLQEAALSGGAWSDVTGSAFTVDFTSINNQITSLTSLVNDTRTTLNTVSADYLKATAFAALSAEIGLDAASSTNKVVTKQDIEDLAGAMHFRGAITPAEGESDAAAIARVITDPKAGDLVIITTTSKEYLYSGTAWIELGDEVLYATKAEVAKVSADLTADYQGQLNKLTATVNTVSSDYLKSADKTELTTKIATVSAETLTAAKAYTDEQIEDLGLTSYIKKGECTQSDLSGFFVLDCGGSSLRTDEPTA